MPNIIEALQSSTEKKKRTVKSLPTGKFFSAKVVINKTNAVIKLPRRIVEYFGLDKDNPEIYWAPINGVIQISGKQPTMVIPMITVGDDEFTKEKE